MKSWKKIECKNTERILQQRNCLEQQQKKKDWKTVEIFYSFSLRKDKTL